MKYVIKKALFLGSLGCVMGVAIGIVLWLIGTPDALSNEESLNTLCLYLVVSGLYGMIAMGSSAVYDIERWSIAKATFVHFIVTLAGFYALGMLEGWLKFGDMIFIIMTVSFVVIYFVIWFTQYMSYKRMIRNMNTELREYNSSKKTE